MTPDQEYARTRRQFRITSLVALAILLLGATFYYFVEDLSWVDAVYFSVITLTTVGYGDISPATDIGKLFTAVYVLLGIGILATFAQLLVKSTVSRRRHRKSDDHHE